MDWVALLGTLGIAVGIFVAYYFLIKKNVPILETIIRDMAAVSKFFINTMIGDADTKEKMLKWADKVPIIWSEIEVSKTKIKAQMVADGKNPDDVLEYQATLIREAMKIAQNIAKEFGLSADEKILYWIGEVLSYLSLFFRKPNNANVPVSPQPIELNVRDVPPQGRTDNTN